MGLPSVWVCCAWVHREFAVPGLAVGLPCLGSPWFAVLGSPWVCRGYGPFAVGGEVTHRQRVVIENNHGEKLVGILHDTGSKELAILCHGFQSWKERIPMVNLAAALKKKESVPSALTLLAMVVAIGFTDSGFVGLPVMVLGVIAGPIWLILSLVVGFVQWVSMGYEVGHGGFLWGVWLAVGRGGLRVFLGGFVGWLTVVEQLTVCLGWL
uniref:Uncharacterized protein n=1 Tax=Fagus sylvatica TaxID=28930 RepID=A0A2N9GF68_FAGSY